ncbi:MAG: 1,6-anhydro-N-acetylmuramyl-L-alanine amidase AmpD [Methylococcaceae bacterium]
MKIDNHWLNQATKVESPNCDERPIKDDISLIVVHCISLPPDQFGGGYIDQLFCNQLNPDDHDYFKQIYQLKVSAHLLIKRCGEVVQYVPFDKRAWHAGVSNYKGKEQCNDYSIGIELEGTETIDYTDAQYKQLNRVIKAILTQYPKLSTEHIVGHCDVSPERKIDPGDSFDWDRLSLEIAN